MCKHYRNNKRSNQLYYQLKVENGQFGLYFKKMAKFTTILRKLKPKISIKLLLFILIISGGCLYQIVQVFSVFLEFETKIDVSIDNNEIGIPMVSFCIYSSDAFRNKQQKIYGLTPAYVYNKTFNFGEIFVYLEYYLTNNEEGYYGSYYYQMTNLAEQEQDIQSQKFNSTVDIQIEKTISDEVVCYNFKHPKNKIKRPKIAPPIYVFILYHQKHAKVNIKLSSKNHSPNNQYDNLFKISGDNFLNYLKLLILSINRWGNVPIRIQQNSNPSHAITIQN